MSRVISCLLLCSTLSISYTYPLPDTPVPVPPLPLPPAPVPPLPLPPGSIPPTAVVPSPFPFAPSPRPGAPGYDNHYFNHGGGPAVPIVSYSSEHAGDGTYAFSFTTADGKQAQENGYLKDAYIDNAGEPHGTQVVQGSYAYISPEGIPIQVSYVADENGFRPSGVHIPANGKGLAPIVDKEKRPIEPFYNHYNPYYDQNRFNPFGQYNNQSPYDPRYPYDPTKFNPYLNKQYQIGVQNTAYEEAKKETA